MSKKNAHSIDSYLAVVDGNKSFPEMIADGRYDYVNPNITENNFPVKTAGGKIVKAEVSLALIHFNAKIYADDFLRFCITQNFRPGDAAELFVLGAKHPELQKQFPVAALKQSWRGGPPDYYRFSPCLWSYPGVRSLSLLCNQLEFKPYFRFLAVYQIA